MRQLLILISALLISGWGCSSTELTQSGGYDYKGIDFREYSTKDFQFTPEKPSGEYESVGIIEVDFYPEIKETNINIYNSVSNSGGATKFDGKEYTVQKTFYNGTSEYYLIEKFNTDSILKEMYELALSWGANAVVNLRFENESFNTGLNWSRVTVRGFAIKQE